MTLPNDLVGIKGAQQLHDWFGYWPAFRDAEILRLELKRDGVSCLTVHTWEATREITERGMFRLAKHAVIEFALEGVTGLDLAQFNQQNAVASLRLEKTKEGFRLELLPSFGLSGSLRAGKVSIRVFPGRPVPLDHVIPAEAAEPEGTNGATQKTRGATHG